MEILHELERLLAVSERLDVVAVLVFVLFGFVRRWWVLGWTYRYTEQRAMKAERERDEWRRKALQGTRLATRFARLTSRRVQRKS